MTIRLLSQEMCVRGFLMWLVLAAPIVVYSPVFWWLVSVEHGAVPTTYQQPDGSVTPAVLGPEAPWPTWAVRPEGGPFRVKAWFGAAATVSANGFGEVALTGDPKMAADDYVARLEAAGFDVTAVLRTTVLPDFIPRQLVTCSIVARSKDGPDRTITASIDRAPYPGRGRVHWVDGPPPPAWPKIEGPPC